MFPIKTFVSERRAANLLRQVRWRDGVYCPRCRGESVIRYGSYRVFQRYQCENCDRTFNDQTTTVFEHSAVALKKWFLAVYTYIRFNTIFRQLDVVIDVSYKTIYRRIQRFLRALDAPLPHLEGPVEIDELYVKAGLKGHAGATVVALAAFQPSRNIEPVDFDRLCQVEHWHVERSGELSDVLSK